MGAPTLAQTTSECGCLAPRELPDGRAHASPLSSTQCVSTHAPLCCPRPRFHTRIVLLPMCSEQYDGTHGGLRRGWRGGWRDSVVDITVEDSRIRQAPLQPVGEKASLLWQARGQQFFLGTVLPAIASIRGQYAREGGRVLTLTTVKISDPHHIPPHPTKPHQTPSDPIRSHRTPPDPTRPRQIPPDHARPH